MQQLFETYSNHHVIAYYIQYLQIQQHEVDLKWLLDAILQVTMPLCWENGVFTSTNQDYYWNPPDTKPQVDHPMDMYFKKLAQQLRTAASMFQPGSIEHRLSLNPPTVIKDILIMCGYLGLEPQSQLVWLAMVALCCDLNDEYYSTKTSYIFTGVSDCFFDPDAYQNFQRYPYTYYKNKRTNEEFAYNPSDLEIAKLALSEPDSEGWCLIPQLEQFESKYLDNNVVLVYDFQTLTSNLVPQNRLHRVKRIKIPDLYNHHQLQGEGQLFVDYLQNHRNIELALIKANSIIYSTEVARTVPVVHLEQDFYEVPQQNQLEEVKMDEQEPLEHPNDYIQRNFVVRQQQKQNKNLQYTDIADADPIIQENMTVKVDRKLDYDMNPSVNDEPDIIYNLRNIRCRPKKFLQMYKIFHKEYHYEKQKVHCFDITKLRKLEKHIQTEKNVVGYLLHYAHQQINIKLMQKVKPKQIIAAAVDRPLNDDNILQQILEHPPQESKFYGFIKINRQEAQLIWEAIRKKKTRIGNLDIDPLDLLVFQLFKQSPNQNITLILTCEITYPQPQDDQIVNQQKSTLQSGFINFSATSSMRAMQQYKKGLQQVKIKYKPIPILTESITKYYVNDNEFQSKNNVQYRQTISDFHINKQIQIGNYQFQISRIDGITKNWLQQSLTKLQKMTQKIEKELISLGQAAFISNMHRVDYETLQSCCVSLREIGQNLISCFERLSLLKPDAKLLKFE